MKLSRRHFVVSTLGLLATGCSKHSGMTSVLPGPLWPKTTPVTPNPQSTTQYAYQPYYPPTTPTIKPHVQAAPTIIPRSQWTKDHPDYSDINAMAGIGRITIHHTGWDPIYYEDFSQTRTHLQKILKYHVKDRHWADIGYHYIIDRGGRIWQARPVHFQGAHVKMHNEHNLGIVLLGNFDRQQPTGRQYQSLTLALTYFQRHYQVPVKRIYTHQELNKTDCPGTRLQRHMVSLRRDGHLA